MINHPVLFISPGCGACSAQEEILKAYFRNRKTDIKIVNLDKYPGKFSFIEFTPTWAFPQGDQKYVLYPNIIKDPKMLNSFSLTNRRSVRFGAEPAPLNSLAVYGKNFPDNKGFGIPNSFYRDVQKVWGTGDDTLNAGIGGTRSLGPNNIGEMYSNGYLNNIRMAHPSDQLGTALNLNRSCNKESSNSSSNSSKGLIYDSPNPQIVDNTTGFGKKGRKKSLRKNLFGGLYSQMGPAYEIGNQYLKDKDTGKKLFSGARQDDGPRPYAVESDTFIGKADVYKPNLLFGKKVKCVKKVKCEGSTISLSKRNNKIKIR